MNRNVLVIIIIIILVVVLGVIVYNATSYDSSYVTPTLEPTNDLGGVGISPTPTALTISPTPSTSQSASVKNFTITDSNYAFTPSQITVNKGDTVKITLINSEGFHDFHIDAFNVSVDGIQANQQKIITFVANQAGDFQYYCSFHKARGMVGTLTVK